MKVLVVGHFHHVRAGSDRYHMELQVGLKAAGVEVIPFASDHPDNEPTPWGQYFPKYVDVRKAKPPDALRFLYSGEARRKLHALLTATAPDVAHLNIYYGQLTGSILSELRRAGVPTIQTLHEYKLICPVYTCVSNGRICEACRGTAFWHAAVKRCNRRSFGRSALNAVEAYVSRRLGDADLDHYLSPSRFLAEKCVQHGILNRASITVLPNGLDLRRFVPRGTPRKRLLYFGRLAPVKGLLTLLDAVAPLDDLEVILAGRGELEGELRKRIDRCGLSHVRLAGHQDESDLMELVSSCFATCVPSEWYENYPLSVIESMAMGRPVIATKVGGLPEMIEHGVDGLLVEPFAADQLGAAIASLAGDMDRARAMGDAARRKALRLWEIGEHVGQVLGVYKRVMH